MLSSLGYWPKTCFQEIYFCWQTLNYLFNRAETVMHMLASERQTLERKLRKWRQGSRAFVIFHQYSWKWKYFLVPFWCPACHKYRGLLSKFVITSQYLEGPSQMLTGDRWILERKGAKEDRIFDLSYQYQLLTKLTLSWGALWSPFLLSFLRNCIKQWLLMH